MEGDRKHLVEVSLLLKAISAQSAREKSIRHGHISILHTGWARRPLATMRAAIFASLVPAPDTDAGRPPVRHHRDGGGLAALLRFYQAVIQPLVEFGAQVALHLRLEASAG